MTICAIDPWLVQYFADVLGTAEARIPIEDSDAWTWNPRHRWVYDRIAVALSQGLAAGPHGTRPPRFPVFSKPIVNLWGMGVGTRVLASRDDYDRHYTAGHMWMTLLTGRHVSSDAAVVSGTVRWWRHVTGRPAGGGMFDYWTVHADADPALEAAIGGWLAEHLHDYTGMVNVETIGGLIIEVHLRASDQWPDLYGHGWVEALAGLYAHGEWTFVDRDRRDGFSVALFGPPDQRPQHPRHERVEEILAMPGVSSVQITFDEDCDPRVQPMPPGGFRLAVVNCWDLEAGLAARERLRACFPTAAKARQRGGKRRSVVAGGPAREVLAAVDEENRARHVVA